jgi:hypothetical protein
MKFTASQKKLGILIIALISFGICYAALQIPNVNQCHGREVGLSEGLRLINDAALIFAGNIKPETHYNHTIFVDAKKIYKATSSRGFSSDMFALQVIDSRGDDRTEALRDKKTVQTVGKNTYLFTIFSSERFPNKNMLDCFRYPFLLRLLLELRPQTLWSPQSYMTYVCRSNGGKWLVENGPMWIWSRCGMPTKDYGKVCSMKSRCEGVCEYKGGKEKTCSKYKTETF